MRLGNSILIRNKFESVLQMCYLLFYIPLWVSSAFFAGDEWRNSNTIKISYFITFVITILADALIFY
jgi:hypothetical protein